MCSLCDKDIVYLNEPFPESRQIRGVQEFREAFEMSPCIWAPEADLQVLDSKYMCHGKRDQIVEYTLNF